MDVDKHTLQHVRYLKKYGLPFMYWNMMLKGMA